MITKDNTKRKEAFEQAALPVEAEIIRLFPEAKPAPAIRETNEEIRLRQYAAQVEMLRIARENAPAATNAEDLVKQNQAPRYTMDMEKTVAGQASKQENGGSIFSSAYSRFHFC